MQKKLVISCVCAISLASIGVAGVYGKSVYDNLHNDINKLSEQKRKTEKEKDLILEQQKKTNAEKEKLDQEKGRLEKELEDQKNKTKETEEQLQQALINKQNQSYENSTQEYYEQEVVQSAPVVAVNYSVDSSSAKEWIASKESSGSYTATNGRYIGRYQLDSSYLGGDHSPENQERVADAYVAGRYGSWEVAQQFWLANGWY